MPVEISQRPLNDDERAILADRAAKVRAFRAQALRARALEPVVPGLGVAVVGGLLWAFGVGVGPFGVAVGRSGRGLRFCLSGLLDPSTRNGRKYARVDDGDPIIAVQTTAGGDELLLVSRDGQALALPVDEVNLVRGPGRGVSVLKLKEGDAVIAAAVMRGDTASLVIQPARGGEVVVEAKTVRGSRATTGKAVAKKLGPCAWRPVPERLDLLAPADGPEGAPADK